MSWIKKECLDWLGNPKKILIKLNSLKVKKIDWKFVQADR